jgi:hypothetical protein
MNERILPSINNKVCRDLRPSIVCSAVSACPCLSQGPNGLRLADESNSQLQSLTTTTKHACPGAVL